MASLNKVLIIGNLTRDPEKRVTPSGTAVVELRMAVNRKFKSSTGEDREEVCYLDVAVWGRTGENCAEYLRKGSSALIEGRLKMDQWEKDGQKRSKISIVAENVQFMDRPGRGGRDEGEGAPEAGGSTRAPARTAPSRSNDDVPPGGPDDDIPF